jgi:protein CpxP
MKINKIFTIVLAAAAFVVSANTIFSQDFKFKKTPEERAQHRADKMQKNLSLTDDQYKQVYSALLSQAQQMKDLKSTDGDKTTRREKMKTIWQSTDATISGILNSEQQTKYQQMKEKRKEKHKQKKGMRKHKKDKKQE